MCFFYHEDLRKEMKTKFLTKKIKVKNKQDIIKVIKVLIQNQ